MNNQRKYTWNKIAGFTVMFILLLSVVASFSPLEAARKDKTAPTAPTNLHTTEVTSTSVSLAWSPSSDKVGVSEYLVYSGASQIGSTSSTTYQVTNLTPNTTYSFYVKARDDRWNLSNASNQIQVTTLSTTSVDNAPSVSEMNISPIATDGQTVSGTVSLSVDATDDTAISKVEFYSAGGSYLIGTDTTAPYSVNWATDPWVPDGTQILKAIAYDNANQTAEVAKTVFVNNTTPTEPAPAPLETTYKRVGYYAGWATYSGYQVADIEASKLTHINYAFANISSDGKIMVGDAWADTDKSFASDTDSQPFKGNFNQLNKLKEQYPHLRTLISVGGWTWSEKFSDVALTEQSRTIFANSVVDFLTTYGFDGVDLDWEYPVGGGATDNVNRPEDKQNFTLLLKEIREALDAQTAKDGKQYLLTIAVGSSNYHANNMELNLLEQYVDYVQLMTYDIHGEWDTLTGLNAPLHRDPDSNFYWEWSVEDSVQTYLSGGIPAEKIVLGLPFYGRIFNQVTNANNGLYQSFTSGKSLSYGNIAANYIGQNSFVRYWEADSKVPYLFDGSTFISYDDVESIGYKTAFIQLMGLGGAMMWELSQDPNEVLLSKIYDDLK